MILVIDALTQDSFADILDEMFQLRARVFADRMGWAVDVKNGRERDIFDDLGPSYLVGLNGQGHVISCARFLQTTGPHMLSDVFHSILDGQPCLRSGQVWESTRFCVDTQRLQANGPSGAVAQATASLMIAMLEYAQSCGISDIVTVIDPVMNRVLKRAQSAPYDYLGTPKKMGKVEAMAALLDCTEARITAVRKHAGVLGDVFISPDLARLCRAYGTADMPQQDHCAQLGPELAAYCRAQIIAAKTPEEQIAAHGLMQHLLKTKRQLPL